MVDLRGMVNRNWQRQLLIGGLLFVMALALSACAGAVTNVAAEVALLGPQQYQQQFGQGVDHALIDVRTPEEFASGHIPGAVNISVESLPNRLNEVPENKPVIVYCRSGNRSASAARILVENGFRPVYDLGGIQDWVAQGFAIQY